VCGYHRNQAEEVLAECWGVYKDAGDVQRLQLLETLIEEERRKVKAMEGDGD
jgi:hypothetical protein